MLFLVLFFRMPLVRVVVMEMLAFLYGFFMFIRDKYSCKLILHSHGDGYIEFIIHKVAPEEGVVVDEGEEDYSGWICTLSCGQVGVYFFRCNRADNVFCSGVTDVLNGFGFNGRYNLADPNCFDKVEVDLGRCLERVAAEG